MSLAGLMINNSIVLIDEINANIACVAERGEFPGLPSLR
jgi:multidrug efflux pump subunit AcrB